MLRTIRATLSTADIEHIIGCCLFRPYDLAGFQAQGYDRVAGSGRWGRIVVTCSDVKDSPLGVDGGCGPYARSGGAERSGARLTASRFLREVYEVRLPNLQTIRDPEGSHAPPISAARVVERSCASFFPRRSGYEKSAALEGRWNP